MSNMTPKFETFNRRLLQITREIQRLRIKHMKPYGLSGIHLGILIALNRNAALTVKELMDVEIVDKAQISRALKDLLNKNYVAPVPGQAGKYKIQYMLTDTGKSLAVELNELTSQIVGQADVGVNEEEIEVMYKTLDKIYANLSKIDK